MDRARMVSPSELHVRKGRRHRTPYGSSPGTGNRQYHYHSEDRKHCGDLLSSAECVSLPGTFLSALWSGEESRNSREHGQYLKRDPLASA